MRGVWWLLVVVVFGVPGVASAGMPSFSLHEVAGARLEVISFFLMGFLVMTLVVKWAWNTLAAVVEWMPRLGLKRSFCLVLLSGLMMYVVLTMISGARELMTPGAWVKGEGVTYKLAGEGGRKEMEMGARESALRRLHWELVKVAAGRGGRFPNNREESGIEAEVWRGADPGREVVAYVGGLTVESAGGRMLAYEARGTGGMRLVLRVDGTVEEMDEKALHARLRRELDPLGGEADVAAEEGGGR